MVNYKPTKIHLIFYTFIFNFLVVIKPIMLTMKHPVFVLNMPERKDRLASIKTQFKNKKEFRLNIVNPIPHKNPRKSL